MLNYSISPERLWLNNVAASAYYKPKDKLESAVLQYKTLRTDSSTLVSKTESKITYFYNVAVCNDRECSYVTIELIFKL